MEMHHFFALVNFFPIDYVEKQNIDKHEMGLLFTFFFGSSFPLSSQQYCA